MIDVWDIGTYGVDVREYLNQHRDLIRRHRERAIELDDVVPPEDPRQRLRSEWPTNEHHPAYMIARDELAPLLESKSFRTFHYTRMTDGEVNNMLRDGIRMTSVDFLNERLQSAVAEKLLSLQVAERIHQSSALRSLEFGVREGFWTTACPVDVADGAVQMLVEHWGGESSYFPFMDGTEDEAILTVLQGIGRGRIFEIEVPMGSTRGRGPQSATMAIFNALERSLGFERSLALDFNILEPLPPAAIRRVLSEGEADYHDVSKAFGYG